MQENHWSCDTVEKMRLQPLNEKSLYVYPLYDLGIFSQAFEGTLKAHTCIYLVIQS